LSAIASPSFINFINDYTGQIEPPDKIKMTNPGPKNPGQSCLE